LFYEFELTVPANTAQNAPAELECLLTVGIISKVGVYMLVGTHWLCHAVITEGGYQVYPSNPDGDFASNGEPIEFEEHYTVKKGHTLFKLKGWNEDDTNEHKVRVRISVQNEEEMPPNKALNTISKFLSRMMGL